MTIDDSQFSYDNYTYYCDRIAPYAFADNTSVTSLNINSSYFVIEDYAFDGATRLSSAVLKGVRRIRDNAFNNCTALRSVEFSEDLMYLGSKALGGCSAMELLTTNIKDPRMIGYGVDISTGGSVIFGGIDRAKCVLKVPTGSAGIYSSATPWTYFSNVVEETALGDINGDGSIDGNDVSILLEMVLAGGVTDEQLLVADLNGDEAVDGNDVSILLEMVLAGE